LLANNSGHGLFYLLALAINYTTNPPMDYQTPPPPIPANNPTGKATAGLVLGSVGLIAWFIPLFGLPVAIVGIVMSALGMKSTSRGMGLAGLIMSIIALILTLINAALGAMMAVSRMHN
jgi:hypothetical protein